MDPLHMTSKPIDLSSPHAYNDPTITPVNFLLAVMHDRNVGLHTRIEAARMALPLCHNPPAQTRADPDLVLKVPPLTIQ
jgi:hypothetical protein